MYYGLSRSSIQLRQAAAVKSLKLDEQLTFALLRIVRHLPGVMIRKWKIHAITYLEVLEQPGADCVSGARGAGAYVDDLPVLPQGVYAGIERRGLDRVIEERPSSGPERQILLLPAWRRERSNMPFACLSGNTPQHACFFRRLFASRGVSSDECMSLFQRKPNCPRREGLFVKARGLTEKMLGSIAFRNLFTLSAGLAT